MKIKDYKCKCGSDDFFFTDKGNQKGIYCCKCGKWLKWADKGERNLEMVSELNKEQKTCKNEDTVLDKIIKDIQKLRNYSCTCSDGIIDDVEDIIDKYREVDV